MKYPLQAKELVRLLREDQFEWRKFSYAELTADNQSSLREQRKALRQRVHQRAQRMLAILEEVGEPLLSNIGTDAAQAVSILALHDSMSTLQNVLALFIECYKRDRNDTYYQAIPSMTDWLCILEHRPQRFGTIWLGLDKREPFLPTVEDFEHVNERRAEYGLEPLRWPKLLTMPESQQPWLVRSLSELVMRDPTAKEYEDATRDFLK